MSEQDYVYVALLDCGCCEGVAKNPDPTVLEWIDAGLAVKRVPFTEWREHYLSGFLLCPHKAVESASSPPRGFTPQDEGKAIGSAEKESEL